MTEKLVIFPVIGSPAIALCAAVSGPVLAVIVVGLIALLMAASFV